MRHLKAEVCVRQGSWPSVCLWEVSAWRGAPVLRAALGSQDIIMIMIMIMVIIMVMYIIMIHLYSAFSA